LKRNHEPPAPRGRQNFGSNLGETWQSFRLRRKKEKKGWRSSPQVRGEKKKKEKKGRLRAAHQRKRKGGKTGAHDIVQMEHKGRASPF